MPWDPSLSNTMRYTDLFEISVVDSKVIDLLSILSTGSILLYFLFFLINLAIIGAVGTTLISLSLMSSRTNTEKSKLAELQSQVLLRKFFYLGGSIQLSLIHHLLLAHIVVKKCCQLMPCNMNFYEKFSEIILSKITKNIFAIRIYKQ